MVRVLITILLFSFLNSFAQSLRIDTLIVPKSAHSAEMGGNEELKFPIIKTGNNKTDALINTDLKNRFTDFEYPDLSTDSTLIKWADERIIYLDFVITFKSKDLISLNISAEGCGAYCAGWTKYFTYSTNTGKYMSIGDIIDTTGKLKATIVEEKDRQFEEQKQTLKETLINNRTELDEATYKWAVESYNECQKAFHIESYALYYDRIEIIVNCYLPNAIKNLTPDIELKYKYSDIKEYLKIKH